MLLSRTMRAVFRRNFTAYFINPTGYVFITVFILLSAIAAFWRDAFFQNNLANLDQLNAFYPLLILFFVPSLTMNIWSEEHREGTDELLFTLPASDIDIVLGKYFAALGIFTVAVLLSLSHLLILCWLGDPDLGLLTATYLAYWLSGAALLAVGMIGSYLARNATVAFLVGAVLCSMLIFIEPLQLLTGDELGRSLRLVGIEPHFRTMAEGSVEASAVIYFAAVTIIALSINVWLVGRRRRSTGVRIGIAVAEGAIRLTAMVVIAASLFAMIDRSGIIIDATSEHLHTLQSPTIDLMREIPADQPVVVQAFISRDMPESFIGLRKTIENVLRRLDDVGGERVTVVVHDVEPFTERAAHASEDYGIESRTVPSVQGGQRITMPVYLGLVFTSGPNEFVIPFFDPGLPVEYELARSIRTVAQTDRKVIGVMQTDAQPFGGLDFRIRMNRPDWSFVEELRKQYDARRVNPSGPYPENLDALVVIMPSSLTQPQLDMLDDAIRGGLPTLLLDDPFPQFNLALAPTQSKPPPTDPLGRPTGEPAQKGAYTSFLSSFGLRTRMSAIVWSRANPHPSLSGWPPEVVFVTDHPRNPTPFDEASPISAGLQNVMLIYPGFIGRMSTVPDERLTFTALMSTGHDAGETSWDDIVQATRFGPQLNTDPERFPSPEPYTLAMHVRGSVDDGDDDDEASSIDLIVTADADIISEAFFQFRRQNVSDLRFDNVTFALNCIDVLAGDASFVALRKHRARHRTLTRVEAESQQFEVRQQREREEAELEAESQLAAAQQRVDELIAEIGQRTDLDENTRRIRIDQVRIAEQQRLRVVEARIERERQQRINRARTEMEQGISSIEQRIKWFAAFVPPIPALIVALLLFAHRQRRERRGDRDRHE